MFVARVTTEDTADNVSPRALLFDDLQQCFPMVIDRINGSGGQIACLSHPHPAFSECASCPYAIDPTSTDPWEPKPCHTHRNGLKSMAENVGERSLVTHGIPKTGPIEV